MNPRSRSLFISTTNPPRYNSAFSRSSLRISTCGYQLIAIPLIPINNTCVIQNSTQDLKLDCMRNNCQFSPIAPILIYTCNSIIIEMYKDTIRISHGFRNCQRLTLEADRKRRLNPRDVTFPLGWRGDQ